MIVIGVDPGHRIGVGAVQSVSSDPLFAATILTDPCEVFRIIDNQHRVGTTTIGGTQFERDWDLHVVIEGFEGSGPRYRAATDTIKIVGYLENACRYADIEAVVRMPDSRRSSLTDAYAILNRNPTPSHDPDDVSALAHALSEFRKRGGRR
jgi:hypothetical protein